jgi:hypothetical protein
VVDGAHGVQERRPGPPVHCTVIPHKVETLIVIEFGGHLHFVYCKARVVLDCPYLTGHRMRS